MYMPCTILREHGYGATLASPIKHGLQVPEHLRAAKRRKDVLSATKQEISMYCV
jgi:hypothetical protein